MERKIIDIIIATRSRYKTVLSGELKDCEVVEMLNYLEEKEKGEELLFVEQITALFDSKKEDFVSAINLFLDDKSDLLNDEKILIDLESVNIFGKRRFRLFIYEICFMLGIEIDTAASRFLNDYRSTCDLEGSRNIEDNIAYTRFIDKKITNGTNNEIYHLIKSKFFGQGKIRTLPDLELNVTFNDDLKDAKKKSKLLETLYDIASLQNQGLSSWCQVADDRTIKRVFSLLNKNFSNKYNDIYTELFQLLKSRTDKTGYLSLEDEDFEKLDELDKNLFELMDLDIIDEIIAKNIKN